MDKKVLLIADDDEMNRAVIKRFLKNSFEVLEAENGRQVVECLEQKKVDMLLLDIIMPVMDGLEVLDAIQESSSYENLGILVATSTKEKTERTALSKGADDVVSKPYDPIVIRKRLENILELKEARQKVQLLQQDGVDSLLEKQRTKLTACIEHTSMHLHKIAEVMSHSIDNPKLLEELIEDIHKEADEALESLKEN